MCSVLNTQFSTAKLWFLYHLPAPSSAFICLSWLFLTHTNSRADIINATLSVLFYLYNQTQDCQFYTTINVSLILAISAWSLRKKMWGLFNVIFLWGFIKTLLTEMRVQGLHLAIKQGLSIFQSGWFNYCLQSAGSNNNWKINNNNRSEVFSLNGVWLPKILCTWHKRGQKGTWLVRALPQHCTVVTQRAGSIQHVGVSVSSLLQSLPCSLQCRSRSPTSPFADAAHYAASENRNLFRLQLTLKIVFKNPFLSKTGCLRGWVMEYRGLLPLTMLGNYQKLVLFDSDVCAIAHTDQWWQGVRSLLTCHC